MGKESSRINLCTILTGHESEIFYCPMWGDTTIEPYLTGFKIYPKDKDKGYLIIDSEGKVDEDGNVILYPSRALYEKYPLDAKKAWNEWAESRKPKRWRAKEGKQYYYLDSCITSTLEIDESAWGDNERYNMGNYFKTREEAQQAADAIRDLLLNFHIKHNEQ